MVFQSFLLEVGEYCPDADFRWAFLQRGDVGVFLRGVQGDTTVDALSSGCAWFSRSLKITENLGITLS